MAFLIRDPIVNNFLDNIKKNNKLENKIQAVRFLIKKYQEPK
jgi:hypothetical protein